MAERPGRAEVPGPRHARGPGRRSAVAALVLALAASGCSGGPESTGPRPAALPATPAATGGATATAPSGPEGSRRAAELQQLLDERAAAVLAGDEAGVLATTDPAAGAFRERQVRTVRGLARVPLASWSYEVVGEGPPLGQERRAELGADAWVADVVLSYRVEGVDPVDQQRPRSLTAVRRDGRWLLADDADGPGRPDLWDLGLVDVVQGRRTLVVGTAARPVLEQQAALGDAAAERVDAVWGTGWPRRTVVLVPADQSQLARLLGRDDESGLEQVAALTTGADRSSGAPGAAGAVDRVLVNPAGLAVLGELGVRVVLAHETTHVAVRAGAATDPPLWLSEGLAELVAWSGDPDLPPRTVPEELLAAVRAGRGPAALPTAADFDTAAGDVAPAYASAWLAVRGVEQRHGREALLELVRASAGRAPGGGAGGGVAPLPQDEAVRRVLGVEPAELEAAWRADLAAAAGAG